jgi:hypothetical protein
MGRQKGPHMTRDETKPSKEWAKEEWEVIVRQMIQVMRALAIQHNLSVDDMINLSITSIGSFIVSNKPNGVSINLALMSVCDDLVTKSLRFMINNADIGDLENITAMTRRKTGIN